MIHRLYKWTFERLMIVLFSSLLVSADMSMRDIVA